MRPPPHHPVESSGLTFSLADDSGSSASLMIGYRFSVPAAGWIVGGAWLQSPNDNQVHTAMLCDNAGVHLKTFVWRPHLTGAFEGAYEWVRRNFKPGWLVEPGATYEWLIGYNYPAYGYVSGALTAALDLGDIVIPANNAVDSESTGLFLYDHLLRNEFGRGEATLYAVDMLFQPK